MPPVHSLSASGQYIDANGIPLPPRHRVSGPTLPALGAPDKSKSNSLRKSGGNPPPADPSGMYPGGIRAPRAAPMSRSNPVSPGIRPRNLSGSGGGGGAMIPSMDTGPIDFTAKIQADRAMAEAQAMEAAQQAAAASQRASSQAQAEKQKAEQAHAMALHHSLAHAQAEAEAQALSAQAEAMAAYSRHLRKLEGTPEADIPAPPKPLLLGASAASNRPPPSPNQMCAPGEMGMPNQEMALMLAGQQTSEGLAMQLMPAIDMESLKQCPPEVQEGQMALQQQCMQEWEKLHEHQRRDQEELGRRQHARQQMFVEEVSAFMTVAEEQMQQQELEQYEVKENRRKAKMEQRLQKQREKEANPGKK